MAIEEHTHRFTTAEYHQLADSGALDGFKVELLDGLLVDKVDVMTQGVPHASLIRAFTQLLAPRADLLCVQLPISPEEGWEPEPDLMLAAPLGDEHPATALLAVEVSVSTMRLDLRKAAVYARAGVPRYWLVDATEGQVLEHTEPGPDGYAVTRMLAGDDVLDAGVQGIAAVTVASVLGR